MGSGNKLLQTNAILHTWFLKPDNVGHIRHVDAAFQDKSRFAFGGIWFVFAAANQS